MTESGLRAVFLRERAMLLRLLVARLGSREDAEDVLQDLWLKLGSLPSGPIAQPLAYLCRMAVNLALDVRRGANRRVSREHEWRRLQSDAAEQPGADDALIARERVRAIEQALAVLPERVGRAFRLYRLEGLPQKRIAQDMGVSLSTVEKMLARAYREIHDAGRESLTADLPRRRLHGKEGPP